MLKYEFTRTASSALLAMLLAGAMLLATLSSFAAEPAANSTNSSCHSQLASIHTDFPPALQSRGEHGDVTLDVAIDKDGRAIAAKTTHSSGYRSLDIAAAGSVVKDWRFDVSRCATAELPVHAIVTVKFQRAPSATVSGTVNTKHVQPQPNNRCDVTHNNVGDAIIACVADATLAGRSNNTSLANRIDAKHRE